VTAKDGTNNRAKVYRLNPVKIEVAKSTVEEKAVLRNEFEGSLSPTARQGRAEFCIAPASRPAPADCAPPRAA
jgi:hypothetical protein